MATVKLEKTITTCFDCPYCRYDPYYDRSVDSGYDCFLAGRRIIDDWDWDNPNNPERLELKMEDIPIPDWCPLREKNDKLDLKELTNQIINLIVRDAKISAINVIYKEIKNLKRSKELIDSIEDKISYIDDICDFCKNDCKHIYDIRGKCRIFEADCDIVNKQLKLVESVFKENQEKLNE